MLASAVGVSNAQDACSAEAVYVSMLGTRKHRLSGENPTVGVFRTTDSGKTWNHMGWKQGKAFAVFDGSSQCPDTLWIAAGNGVMRSTDGGSSWRITTGWEVTEVQDVWVSPSDPTEIWAATPYGVYRSKDFGDSWDDLGGGFASSVRNGFVGTESGLLVDMDEGPVREPVRSIRQSPHDPETWAVALQDGGVRVSQDDGKTFSAGSPEGATVYEVEFHPVRPSVLYAGGWGTGLLRSGDLGATWIRIASLKSRNIHGIAISRADPLFMVVGTMDDGVFMSFDGGVSWVPADTELFDQGQIWDVYVKGE
jgi:photosystem II stability/assembly factor-like uncharacterized protein